MTHVDSSMTLAEKLEFLRDRMRRPDGRKYTHDQIATFMTETTGRSWDRGYVSALCSGSKDNPSKMVLEALASFFDVTPAFFFDDEHSRRLVKQINLGVMLADDDVRELALRMLAEVDTEDVEMVVAMLESIMRRRQKATEEHAAQPPERESPAG